MSKPVVLIACDVKQLGEYPFHAVGEKYINAVALCANAMPLLLPALGAGKEMSSLLEHYEIDRLLDRVDGVFLTGSYSNVHPKYYDGEMRPMELDEQRDATALPLITKTLARKLPLLAVCRGLQELNVALGGTLDSQVHASPERMDHRENENIPRDQRYEPAHPVHLHDGGMLAALYGEQSINVNSLHAQGIARLADGLRIEATAPDGLVEAASLRDASGWALGVQWHPEWRASADPQSVLLFRAFGDALRQKTS